SAAETGIADALVRAAAQIAQNLLDLPPEEA
ncbi:Proline iminopeptidase, partial [Pseudomonas syringae pv. maculicola]